MATAATVTPGRSPSEFGGLIDAALATVELRNVLLYAADVARLVAALGRNAVVKTLVLCNNGLGPAEVSALAAALAAHPVLAHLTIRQNYPGNVGIAALGRALATNTALDTLVVDCFLVDARGAHEFLDSVQQHNATLRCCQLAHGNVGYGALKRAKALMARNQAFQASARPPVLAMLLACRRRALPLPPELWRLLAHAYLLPLLYY